MVASLRRRAQRSAAAPCSHTAQQAASCGVSPCARSAASIPASTSPLPPRASPGLPVALRNRAPSGVAMRVPAPFRTTVQPYFSARCTAALSRSACTCAVDRPSSRAASPGWGVSTAKGGTLPRTCPAASAFSASASSTMPCQSPFSSSLTTAPAPSPSPGPASSTGCLSASQSRSAAASLGWIQPSAPVRQPQAQHSGVRVSTS